MSIGPRKLLAGVFALIAAASVWPAAVWLDVEVVLAAVAVVAIAALLVGLFAVRDGRRQAANRVGRDGHVDQQLQKLTTQNDQLRSDIRTAGTQIRDASRRTDQRLNAVTDRIARVDAEAAAGRKADQINRRIGEVERRVNQRTDQVVAEARQQQQDQLAEVAAMVRRVGRSASHVEDVRAAVAAQISQLRHALPGGDTGTPAVAVGAGSAVESAEAAMDAVEPTDAQQLRDSGLLDAPWYRRQAGLDERTDPAVHYLGVGCADGMAPAPWIDTDDLRKRLMTDQEPVREFLAREAAGQLPGVPELVVPLRADDPIADLELRWRYLLTGGYRRAHTFSLVRVIGNDLPPRHKPGQSLQNLKFVLEHEPELPGAKRHWLLNRITDPDIEAALIKTLEDHDAAYTRIPFNWDEYRAIGWRYQDFPERGFVYGPPNRPRHQRSQTWILDHVYHDKNRYVMHNNGARNLALAHGRNQARWALPFDGNGYFTRDGFCQLTDAIAARPHLPYVLVPMARVAENNDVLNPEFSPNAVEEPQVVFRSDAAEQFDPNRRYGRRPKVDLLQRLAVPGPWERWVVDRWESAPVRSPEAGQFHTAGYVVRLSSGQPALEANIDERGWQRTSAIQRRLDDLDVEAAYPRFSANTTLVLEPGALAPPEPDPSADRPTAPPLVAGTAEAALERAVVDLSAHAPDDTPAPTALAGELLALSAMHLRSDAAPGITEALDERIAAFVDVIDQVLPGSVVPTDEDEAADVDPARLPSLPAGFAAALLEFGRVCADKLGGREDGRLRRIATYAMRHSGLRGPRGVQYFEDSPLTVWQLLDELSAHAFRGKLGYVLATGRKADELRALRAQTVAAQSAGSGQQTLAVKNDRAVAIEAGGWMLFDHAIARYGRPEEDPGWRWSLTDGQHDDVFSATYQAVYGEAAAGMVMALYTAATDAVTD